MDQQENSCIFCKLSKDESRVVCRLESATAILDGFPVTFLHTLIIPNRCIASYFDLTPQERSDCEQLLKIRKQQIESSDPSVDGFNIGVNVGRSAGQTVFHCHIHLISRRIGDMQDPKGGVRGVIPGKQKY